MIYKIFSSKDTFITNYLLNGIQRTGSNFGACEILHLFKETGNNLTSSLGRILTIFDLQNLSSSMSRGEIPGNAAFFLKLSDAQHDQTLPTSFDIEVQAVSQQWDEGTGFDVDTFADKGFANWIMAKSNSAWTIPGASGTGSISVAHFDSGHENLEVDVTNIVNSWLSGTVQNNGFLVKLSSSLEVGSQDYYIKMFHGRETFFKDKRPCIEVRWDDSVKDDRNNFFFDLTGSLKLQNVVRGKLQDIQGINGQLGVSITDVYASSTLSTFTGSRGSTVGLYEVNFAIPSGQYSGSLFRDTWFNLANTGSVFMTGTFNVLQNNPVSDISPKRYYVNVTNLKNSYTTNEKARLNLFVRPNDYNPARQLTASLDANGTVITNGYYQIENDRTDEVVIPFSTGVIEYTRLSYDQKGNYFNLNMSSLSPGNVYRIVFLFDVDGQQQYLTDAGLKFRVI